MAAKDTDKEIERLRWEYLKRSEFFMKWWKALNDRVIGGDKSAYKKLIDGTEKTDLPILKKVRWAFMGRSRWIHLADKAPGTESFDEYWEMLQKSDNKFDKSYPKVTDYSKIIGEDIDRIVAGIRKEGHEPSIDELKEALIDGLSWPFNVYFRVTQRRWTQKEVTELTREMGRHLAKRVPKKRFVKADLERYLRVYDMRNQKPPLTYREIHNTIYPKLEFSENSRRALIKDFNKAKTSIKNVEEDRLYYW